MLLVLSAAAVTAACPSAGVRFVGPGLSGGGGGGGGGTGSASLVGTWRNLTTVFSGGDTIVTQTVWTFTASGTCSKSVTQTFVNSGSEFTFPTQDCTYTFSGSSVTVTFVGSSVATRFSVAFSGGDLILDGFRFTRIG